VGNASKMCNVPNVGNVRKMGNASNVAQEVNHRGKI